MTMSGVVERSGVARATVYLRWPNRHALLIAAVRRAMGQPVIRPTGDVEGDLRRGADRARAILTSPAFRSVFPALVEALTTGEDRVSYDTLAPGRMVIGREYDELAAAAGFRTDVSGEVAADLLIGAQISHYLATGKPPTEAQRDQSVSIVFDGLRRRRAGESG
jgi:AcrR family transcriptional regulator